MVGAFAIQEEEICRTGIRGHGAQGPVFWIRIKSTFTCFFSLFDKSILKQQHAGNAAKVPKLTI